MVEIKAVIQLEDVHLAQAINYLEAYGLEVGLLLRASARDWLKDPGYTYAFGPEIVFDRETTTPGHVCTRDKCADALSRAELSANQPARRANG